MTPNRGRTYAMLIKPVGAACNLRCEYCYYLDKGKLLGTRLPLMNNAILETVTRQILAMHGADATVEFAWHGGEPLLAGMDFYERALALQKKYGRGRRIVNTLQTNATLIDEKWCDFFYTNNFNLGVSVDGPKDIHNIYRSGAFDFTLRGMGLLRAWGVKFAALTTVNVRNMSRPLEVYDFACQWTDDMQFLPVVESRAAQFEKDEGQRFAASPGPRGPQIRHPVANFSVTPEGYGDFMCAIFDKWYSRDRGVKHVQLFDVAMENLSGANASLCVHNPLCGHSGCIEVNGDVYACDRYAFPAYKLGNILDTSLADIMEKNREFGMHKAYGLAKECFECPELRLCFGGCHKDRLDGHRNYLCEGYRRFFERIRERSNRHKRPC